MSESPRLRLLLLAFPILWLLISPLAYAENNIKAEEKFRPQTTSVFSGKLAVRKIPQYWQNTQAATSGASSKTILPNEFSPTKTLNIRIHPLHLLPMLTDKHTKVSLRTDVDVVLSSKFTLGPSVIYQEASNWDDSALAAGNIRGKNESHLELGLLSNIHLTGNTSQGGLLLRPHVFWVQVQGERNQEKGNIAAGSSKPGWRAGSEVVFQKILPNGFNFEIGAGFTYHFIPYSVNYESPQSRTAPASTIMPTLTAGIGWAF